MNRSDFRPGFRLSPLDVIVLALGTVAAGGLLMVAVWGAFVVAFVVGHFFLFCNVFRNSRSLELAWGGLLTALAALTVVTGYPGWIITVTATLAATVFAILLEMCKPSYHGIFWQWVNPKLREWWESREEV